MKGIILAGGTGSRLYPMTKVVSKQLLPIYDKPMIYYPLSILLLAGIRDVLIISNPDMIPFYESLLGAGSRIGIRIEYKIQESPRGLAEALILGKDFIGNDSVCLILGDNLFYGTHMTTLLQQCMDSVQTEGACILGISVKNPSAFGIVEFDSDGKVCSIEEKPRYPKSNFAVPGLYFFDNRAPEIAETVTPSERGELEITSVIDAYLKLGTLHAEVVGRGLVWLDTGTPGDLLKASEFVETLQSRQGYYISCIEEIAWRRGFISTEVFRSLGEEIKNTEYGKYIISLSEEI